MAKSRKKAPAAEIKSSKSSLVVSRLKRLGTDVNLKKAPWPVVGATAAAGAGMMITAAVGAGELVVGVALGYAAYQMLRHGRRPSEVLRSSSTAR